MPHVLAAEPPACSVLAAEPPACSVPRCAQVSPVRAAAAFSDRNCGPAQAAAASSVLICVPIDLERAVVAFSDRNCGPAQAVAASSVLICVPIDLERAVAGFNAPICVPVPDPVRAAAAFSVPICVPVSDLVKAVPVHSDRASDYFRAARARVAAGFSGHSRTGPTCDHRDRARAAAASNGAQTDRSILTGPASSTPGT